jgi:tetratricopeptide (TPR) repeat protein
MKWLFGLVIAGLVLVARAQSLDDQYVQIFNLIQEGDTLRATAPGQALAKYVEAQTALQRFQKGNPDWNTKLVEFRLLDLANKIAALSASAPAPTAAESAKKPAPVAANPTTLAQPTPQADLENQVNRLTEQVRQLQANNVILETKLKEAFAVQPAESDPRELVRAQDKIKALEKENELLKVTVDSQKSKPVPTQIPPALDQAEKARLEKQALESSLRQANAQASPNVSAAQQNVVAESARVKQLENERSELQKKLDKANKELAGRKAKAPSSRNQELDDQLLVAHARIEALETKAVPYSAEELVLLKAPEPKLAVPPANSGKKSVKELPPGSVSLVAEAQRSFAAKQYDKAEASYQQVLKQDENNVPALANLAAIQVEAQHLDAAEKNIKKALAHDPDDAYSLYVLGLVKFRQAKYDDALDTFSRCAKLDPQNPELQNYLGLALSEKGMRGPAEAALRKAIQLQPGYGSAHYNLAIVYLNQKPPAVELARWHYQKAVAAGHEHNPDLEKKFASAP